MAKAREATRKVTVDMLGEKSLADWNTLQNYPYTHRDKEYREIHVNGDGWVRKLIDNQDGRESYYMGSTCTNQRYGFFTRPSGILANILDNNKDINPDWLKTFTWPKWSSRISFPTINHFADRDEVFSYLCDSRRKQKLFGKRSTIKFNNNLKWTYLGNMAHWSGGVYLVVLNGKSIIAGQFDIMCIIEQIYLGSDD